MEKENKLGTMPISKLIINMSLPIIISMLVQALYNIVDSVFVSRVCEQALTAVSLAFPAQNLMIGLATGTAVGVNALMGRALGAKDQERANAVAINGVFLAVVGFAICAVLALLFAGPFFRSQTQIDYIVENGTDYLLVCCCGSLGLFCEIMFERLLQGTGRSILSMYTQGLGAIVNIVLDPIFIFVLDMGEPVRIMDLAKKLIRAYGYEPNVDMPIKIIGLRPGEKLYEELLMDSERDKMTRTAHKKIFVANVDKIDDAQYDHMMQVLQSVEDKNDERAVEAIAEIVPTYHPDEKNRPDNKVELAEKDEKQAAG